MQKFLELVPNNLNLDFVGKFKYFVVLSLVCFAFVFYGMLVKPGFNFGVDFTGGTTLQIKFKEPRKIEDVRDLAEKLAKDATVVSMGKEGNEYLINARQPVDPKEVPLPKRLLEAVGADKATITQADIVGPKVGAELKMSAIRSLVYAVLLIMVYIWFRFDFRFAPGATLAMVHDMTIATAYYLITQKEFDITAIAALLTIAGYSVNDTIVIYDRVREILRIGGDQQPLGTTINKAINLTLSRTLITSGATFLTVVPIAIICTGPIQSFAQTMLIGIFVGTYSSYYIAAPMTIYVEKHFMKKGTSNRKIATV